MSRDYEPEMDSTPELGQEDHTMYQELIGKPRWVIEIGCVDTQAKRKACDLDSLCECILRV